MKRGILFVALGMTVAGVASANVFTAASSNVALQPQSRDARTRGPAVVQKASLEARQAPVPLQVKHRPPVNLPAVETKAGETTPDEAGNGQETAASSDGFDQNAVKAAIEADGYKGARVLRKDVNGVWHATGLRGRTVVLLVVDASGSVAAE